MFTDITELHRFWRLARKWAQVVGVCEHEMYPGLRCELFTDHEDLGFPHWNASALVAWDRTRVGRPLTDATLRDMIAPVEVGGQEWLTWPQWFRLWWRSLRWRMNRLRQQQRYEADNPPFPLSSAGLN